MKIERHLKVSCSNHILHHNPHGYPWREWKIRIRPVETNATTHALKRFINRVEYNLHESFKDPRVVCDKEPYEIVQQGWGEFSMAIVFYFVDPAIDPQTLWFDLHFARSKYTIYSTLTFQDPPLSFEVLLRNPPRPTTAPRLPSKDREDEFKTTDSESVALKDQISRRKRRRSSSAPSSPDPLFDSPRRQSSSSHDELDFEYWPTKPVQPQVDVKELGDILESLEGNDLRELYSLFQQHNTPKDVFVEIQDAIFFDLCGLSDRLLSDLWAFSRRIKYQRS
ncbi:yeats family-domain-containing protein [Phycomyces nitens]|nr:yeats family-domain-containing protein [Phycomyces nitens]